MLNDFIQYPLIPLNEEHIERWENEKLQKFTSFDELQSMRLALFSINMFASLNESRVLAFNEITQFITS